MTLVNIATSMLTFRDYHDNQNATYQLIFEFFTYDEKLRKKLPLFLSVILNYIVKGSSTLTTILLVLTAFIIVWSLNVVSFSHLRYEVSP